jgi:uncharacterized OsmC-like protein
MGSDFAVTAASGSFRSSVHPDAEFPHLWTQGGVAVEMQFTGAHLLHLATAGCVLNDLYRGAAQADIELKGVRVTADGDFDRDTWRSTGIRYRVELESDADKSDLAELVRSVDDAAEIPKAMRAETVVTRIE